MSPQAGFLLVDQIVPRLRSAIPKCVAAVGAEDAEELVQDAICLAAKMLHNVEAAGKTVTPGNIAYYTILHMKTGRRSQCCSRADAMANGTMLDDRSSVLSVEEEVGYDEELGEPITLGEMLGSEREDPAMAGARNIDWEKFVSTHDRRYTLIVQGMAEGRNLRDTVSRSKHSRNYSRMFQLKQKLARDLQEFLGEDAIADATEVPAWKASLKVNSEKAACTADRRRW
jgi:hypothetical protein